LEAAASEDEMNKEDVTTLLREVGSGDDEALEALVRIVYRELRRVAGGLMRSERNEKTLQPTALVHEAYLRLFQEGASWENRAHFFGAASRAMRRILVEQARKRRAAKRGGGARPVTFEDLQVAAEDPQIDLIALDEALEALGHEDPRLARIVELRYFAGLSIEGTAKVLSVSVATVKRDWAYARAWLYDRLSA
jgi:RNA polymerase sigma-70 factor, ECF subfamily